MYESLIKRSIWYVKYESTWLLINMHQGTNVEGPYSPVLRKDGTVGNRPCRRASNKGDTVNRLHLRVALVVAAVVVPWAVTASPVVPATPALAKCQPGRTNDGVTYKDGWQTGSIGLTIAGIRSDIYNYSPWVQTGTDGVTGWVMLQDDSLDWAQIGWEEKPAGARCDFYQYGLGGIVKSGACWSPGESVGSVHTYQVLYNNTPGQFTYFRDGTQYAQTSADFIPTDGVIAGETKTLASQMPGSVSVNESFQTSYYYAGGGWNAFNGATFLQPNNTTSQGAFGNVISNWYEAQIWDKACYS
jgi:hypothetical protein